MLTLLIYFLAFYINVLSYDKPLIKIRNDSALSLPELWVIQNSTYSPSYNRKNDIDEWDIKPPYKVVLNIKDSNGRTMFTAGFNTTGSPSNISSWLTYDRFISGNIWIKSPFIAYVSDNSIELTDTISEDMAYFVHGKYNNTTNGQFIQFTKPGEIFPLSTVEPGERYRPFWASCFLMSLCVFGGFWHFAKHILSAATILSLLYGMKCWQGAKYDNNERNATTTTEHNSVTFLSTNHQNSSGFTEYFINLFDISDTKYYLKSLSVYNVDDTNMTFTFAYSPWIGQCRNDTRTKPKTKYVFTADGQLNIIDVFKVICLWIYLSGTAYNINVTLNEPVDDFIPGYQLVAQAFYVDEILDTATTATSQLVTFSNDTMDTSTSQLMFSDITTIETTEVSSSQPSTDIVTTLTPKPMTTSLNNITSVCDCKCEQKTINNKYGHLQNLTTEQLVEALKNETDKIRKELIVDRTILSSTIRKKISARDERSSAKNIGYIGALIIGFTLTLIVLSDILWYQHELRKIMKKCCKRFSL